MMKVNWNLYFCSIFLIAGGATGYVAISQKISGSASSTPAILIATAISTALAATLAAIWIAQNMGARYILLAKGSFLFTASAFMIGIGSPIFLVIPPTSWLGASTIAAITTTAILNSIKSYRYYKSISIDSREEILKTIKGNRIDLDKFSRFFLDYPPTVVTKLSPKIGVPIAISGLVCMVLGLSLYRVYPIFSVVAWGVPTLLVPAFLLPVLTQALVQQSLLANIEKQIGQRLTAKVPIQTAE